MPRKLNDTAIRVRYGSFEPLLRFWGARRREGPGELVPLFAAPHHLAPHPQDALATDRLPGRRAPGAQQRVNRLLPCPQ